MLINPTTKTHSMTQKEKEDYYKFFTTEEGADMLPYVYSGSSDAYDELVKNCPDYYLCRDEIAIIKQNTDVIAKHLVGVTDVVEIGPGSAYPVEHKTLPILRCAPDLQCYHAVDYSESYLHNAVSFLKQNIPDIQIRGVAADLMNGDINLGQNISGKKCVLFLGGTLGSFNTRDQESVIASVSQITNNGDIIIITADTNSDIELVLKAYSNEYDKKFIGAVLEYYSKINPQFSDFINSFEIKFIWVESLRCIEAYFVAQHEFSFNFDKNTTIVVRKGQELRSARSRKFTTQNVENLMHRGNFKVLEILNLSGKMTTLICTRVNDEMDRKTSVNCSTKI